MYLNLNSSRTIMICLTIHDKIYSCTCRYKHDYGTYNQWYPSKLFFNYNRASLQTQLRSQLNGAMAARNTLDKCLEQLKVGGKPGKQWIRIRKLLAPTRPSDRCLVFKSFKFPVLRTFLKN